MAYAGNRLQKQRIASTPQNVIYVKEAALKIKDFRVLVFPDVPAIEKRYILCSKSVPASVVDKLNKEIDPKLRQSH